MSARRWGALLSGLMLACGKDAIEPVPGEIVSLVISPVLDTLVSLEETVQLAATAYDRTGAAVAGASFSWSSENPAVASISEDGLVTAQQNGAAVIQATAAGTDGHATMVVRQRAAAFDSASGDFQAGTVGMPLDTSVALTARDALGHPAVGVTVTFDPSGTGHVAPAQSVTDSAGRAGTSWTLGTEAGTQELTVTGGVTATMVLTASAFADAPDTMYLESGDQQIELPSLALPQPLRIKVLDRYGNGVPDVPIAFSVSGGVLDNGTDTLGVPTDLNGVAATQWTLGSSLGLQTGRAVLPDSAVGDNLGLPGSPVLFSATAVAFAFAGISPATPVVGQSMILNGAGFHPDPSSNVVMVDGISAAVTGGNQTSLTVTVPSFGCVPARSRTISVTRGSETDSTSAMVKPAGALILPVGGTAVLSDPADYCLQFLSSGNSAEEYLVGLTATRRLAGELPFTVVGDDGATPPPAPPAPAASSFAASLVAARAQPEIALRAWEEEFFARRDVRPAAPRASASGVAGAPRALGGTVALRVPNVAVDACNQYTAVTATVLAEGPRGMVVTDAVLPSDPVSVAAISAAIQDFVTTFGDVIYQVATTYFGLPTDLDQDGRIILLFSNTVTSMGMTSLTSAVDFVDPAVCPASNAREVVYVGIPAAPSAAQLAALLQAAPPHLAHDLTHLIQFGRRIVAGGVPLAAWLGEGQAELGTELVGMALRGDASRRDYGADVVSADQNALGFYRPRFDRLSHLFGWDGEAGTVAGAPERCSLFGFGGVSVPCAPAYAAGAAWSFIRYLNDRLGAAYQGGDAAWQQALIGLDPGGDGTSVLETLAGADLPRLMVDWAMTLYTDGRITPGDARALQMPSWNLSSVFGALPAVQRLNPAGFGFASFGRSGSVTGGGTAYTLLQAAAPHGALSVRVANPSGGDVGTDLRPRLWVVRVK